MATHTKKQKTISNRHFFLMEKSIEDVRQDEKHVPDLLESIMRPTDPVKEELRQKLFKMNKFDSKIKKNTENQCFKILDSRNPKFSRWRPTQPSRAVGFKQETAFQTRINPKNVGFNHLQALLPKVKSSKMGLSITPRGRGSEPACFQAAQPHFRDIWPR